MKASKAISALLLLLFLAIQVHGQDNAVTPQRTPEQEAVKQTEKLQQELNLSIEQVRQVYEINLRYARERQISNTRSEAIERMKNKSAEIQRILNPEQKEHLQTKRYERTVIESPSGNQRQPTMSSGFRSTTEFRNNSSVRIPSSEGNMRSSYRSSSVQTTTNYQSPQTVRRSSQGAAQHPQSTPSVTRNQQTQQASPTSGRSSSESLPSSTRRSEQNSGSRR
jgi:hypothetical protein